MKRAMLAGLIIAAVGSCGDDRPRVVDSSPARSSGVSTKFIEIYSNPLGARIEINGTFVGITPVATPVYMSNSDLTTMRVVAYPSDPSMPAVVKSFSIPPLPSRIDFNIAGNQPMQQRSPSEIASSQSQPDESFERRIAHTPPPNIEASPSSSRAPSNQSVVTAYRTSVDFSHWISDASNDGTIIRLEDGSTWEIDETDGTTTSLWSSGDQIALFTIHINGMTIYEMRNTDSGDDERISASPLR
ncbi:MAG: PEGA domain-containing protein [Phycisphaerales bacterium]|nr:PEGA domain-containing protein [Phycisphaerales bacterium]MCB9856522.1 PEGA domain-containing protein [Phycisphaerales bacterium]